MAIEFASGTYYGDVDTGTNAATGSFNLTIPSDCDCLVVFVSTYISIANGLTSSTSGCVISGSPDVSPDHEITACDDSTSFFQGAGWVWLDPPTGAQTIEWSFSGGEANDHQFAWIAYKGVGSIRGSNGGQQWPAPSVEFTASSGDKIVCAIEQYYNGDTTADWTNATKIADMWDDESSLLSIADMTADGNETISATYSGGVADGGLMGVVLIPASGAPTGNPWYYYAQQMRQKLEEKLNRRIVIPGFADCMRYGFAR